MSEFAAPARRKRRADAERARDAVLHAAVQLLGSRPEASLEEIAAAAGVVRQTVYAHFRSRESLLAAVVDHITAETVTALGDVDLTSGSAVDALRRWLDASWSVIERFPVLLNPAVMTAAPDGDEVERHRPVLGGLEDLLRRGRLTREFDDTVPLTWSLAAVVALGHAAGQQVAAGLMSPVDAGVAFRDSVVRVCLRG
jgi:AcrR family transcriptional regulator